MAKILILYHTSEGQTKKIVEHMESILRQENIQHHSSNQTYIAQLPCNDDIDLNSYDKIILGASIHYGKHNQAVYDFVNQHSDVLNAKESAFFSVNLVARKPQKNTPDTNPYMDKFFSQVTWHPSQLAVFAGRVQYDLYSFWDRLIIKLIMRMTNGPTSSNTCVEYTDWGQVTRFAKSLSKA